MTTWINRIFTHSRLAGFLAWLAVVWAALEAQGQLTWPPTKSAIVIIIGATITMLARSVLAPKKQQDPPPDADAPDSGEPHVVFPK